MEKIGYPSLFILTSYMKKIYKKYRKSANQSGFGRDFIQQFVFNSLTFQKKENFSLTPSFSPATIKLAIKMSFFTRKRKNYKLF